MLIRSIICQSTLFLVLGVGLQSPTLDAARLEGPPSPDPRSVSPGLEDRQERREARPERREEREERREARPERREEREERREARPERREDRQERREGHRDKREQRNEPSVYARPRPLPRPAAIEQPGSTTQSRPHPRSAAPSDPGSTVLPHGKLTAPHSRSRAQAQAWERSHGWRSEGAWAAHPTWQQHRARAWESEHRTWAHRGGYGGYIIPESQFRLHYGPDRWFRIRTRPMIHMGYPRFRYGNYWFLIVDPWPEFWSENWYADDDVYVDYNDGYYLYNRRHPGVSIAISVSM